MTANALNALSDQTKPQPEVTATVVASQPLPRGTDRFVPPDCDALGVLFPQLEILQLLGQGGMGAVYKARQRGLERLIALKILPPGLSTDAGFAERFKREAQALARLNHPNIVTVFDLGKSGPLYYFLMEFVDGVNLRQLLESHQLTAQEALALVPQICEALEYAHGEGIIHRDIKPENILVDQKGRVKLADFGLSKLLARRPEDIQLTQADHFLGTMHYIAPEQLENPAEVDPRADIYSLGVVFYEMLTGELPLGRFEVPSKKAGMDARLDDLVLRALERQPGKRFQQASEMRLELEAIAGVTTKLSPEASRKLSYEYRSKTTLFGWPLLHVAMGVNPATGRKRSAKGIIAIGTAPRGVLAFGDVAVGVIACGIFGYGLISVSVVAVGVFAWGSLAAGLLLAMGGVAIAPVAIGGAAMGWLANGALGWGRHVLTPQVNDPVATQFFYPYTARLMSWVFKSMLVAVPVFLTMGFVPTLMARMAERRANKARRPKRQEIERGRAFRKP